MEYVFYFLSRNSGMRFMDDVLRNGVSARVVNTPELSNGGCGMAIRCSDYSVCYNVIYRSRYSGLHAVYEVENGVYKRIYTLTN